MAGLAHARDKFSFDPRKSKRGAIVWTWIRIGLLPILLTAALCSPLAIDVIREAATVMAEPAIGAAEAAESNAKRQGYVWSATLSDSDIRLRGFVPSEEVRGTVLGLNVTSASFGWLGAASLGGWMMAGIGFGGFGPLTAGVALLGAGLAVFGPRGTGPR